MDNFKAKRFAEIVGEEGKIYAVDTNPKFLESIQRGRV